MRASSTARIRIRITRICRATCTPRMSPGDRTAGTICTMCSAPGAWSPLRSAITPPGPTRSTAMCIPDGTRLGERAGDEPQFDPGVLREGERTYLYTGFCGRGDKSRHGAMCTTLGPDMLTVREAPGFVAPGVMYSKGTGFEGHEFFEAPSIRKRGDLYYFIYSSILFHELCYAVSKNPPEASPTAAASSALRPGHRLLQAGGQSPCTIRPITTAAWKDQRRLVYFLSPPHQRHQLQPPGLL